MPTSERCYDYVKSMALSKEIVDRIEETTRKQADSKLWCALHTGRLTSSQFDEIIHQQQTTDPRRLVRDIMGCGKLNHSKYVPYKFDGVETMNYWHVNVTLRTDGLLERILCLNQLDCFAG